jgi:DNA polymerase I
MTEQLNSYLPEWVANPNPDLYLSDNHLILDFEATIADEDFLPPYDPNVDLVSGYWKYRGKRRYVRGNEYAFGELLEDIDDLISRRGFVVAHAGKYELGWLRRMGVDLTRIIIYDTAIGEYVLAGNRSWAVDFHSVSRRYGGSGKRPLYARLMRAGVCPSTWPDHWLEEYNSEDVEGLEPVFLQQRVKLKEMGLLPTMYTRCLLTPVLADIEPVGMCVDRSRAQAIYTRLTKEYNDLMVEVNAFTGGINTRSPKQMSEFLYDNLGFPCKKRNKQGNGPTDATTMAQLTPKTAKQRKFLELKKREAYLYAKLSKSFQKFMDCLDDPVEQGILRFNFNQTVTATHRLSSNGMKHKVQGQNLDRQVKPVFKARNPGWKIGEADQASLEWRGALFLSHDPVGLAGLAANEDVHSYTASIMFPEELIQANGGLMPTLPEIKKKYSDWRQAAKPDTFAPVYGAEEGHSDAQRAYYEAFRKKYPTLCATQDGWVQTVLRDKQLRTITGLIFYWPDTKQYQAWHKRKRQYVMKITNRRNIYNYPIQSLATADIVPIGVVCLWHRMKSAKLLSFLVNTVHDSAIAEVAPGEEEVWQQIAKQAFVPDTIDYLKKCYNIDWDVPLEAETKVGEFWNDSDKWVSEWLQ